MTWFLEFEHNGTDVLAQIHEQIVRRSKAVRRNPDVTSQNYAFRDYVIEALGYFPTESDCHFPEYMPYYQHEDRWDYMRYYDITKGVKGKRQALLFDPATQAVLNMKRIGQMFDEMWKAEQELLTYYE